MPEFGSPFSGLANDRKLTSEELIRAIRFTIASEYEAAQLYTQLAESTDNALASKVLTEVANEELVHAGEFLRLLRSLSPNEADFYAEGEKEVEEIEEKMSPDYEAIAKRATTELYAPSRRMSRRDSAEELLRPAAARSQRDIVFGRARGSEEGGMAFSGLANGRKLTDAELATAIRPSYDAELEAVQLYTRLAASTDNASAAKTLGEMAADMLEHAGEINRLLHSLSPSHAGLRAEATINFGAIAKQAAGELCATLQKTSGGTLTARDLLNRADDAIENGEDFIYDVAADVGQIVDNVRHMRWFQKAVANWLIENTKKWSHLPLLD